MMYPHVKQELIAYREGNHPYPFGSFLTAILANDLVGAVGHADDVNIKILGEYTHFLYNEMPGRCGDPQIDMWGSYEAVSNTIHKQWITMHPTKE